MYLIYVDESGTIDIGDSENFVLGAVIVNEDRWFELDKRVKELKDKYFSGQAHLVEIHMCDIAHRKGWFSRFRPAERTEIIEDILELIKKVEMRTVYVVIKKQELLKKINIRYWAYEFLFERICYQLKDMNEGKEKEEYGILLFDSIGKKRNSEIWDIVSKLLEEGGRYEMNKHLIDGPIFSESNIRSPLQIADCVAYIVNHHHKFNQNKDENMKESLEKGFEIIEQKMPSHKRYSRKVFP